MLAMSIVHHRFNTPVVTPKQDEREVTVRQFRQELILTPQQTEQLETILDDFFTYYHTLQAQLDDVRASGKQRILRILDENQKRRFEKIMAGSQEHQPQLR